MKGHLQVLMVEDSEDDARLLIRELERGGYEISSLRVETAEALKGALVRQPWQLMLCDFSLPHFSGEAALRMVRESGLDLPFIYVSGTIGEDIAVEAMKGGADDYVMKNNLARLVPAVERELREAEERQRRRRAETDMRISEHKYRHLFRSMSDAALLVAEETGKIIDANDQAEVLLGRTRDEILGMNSGQLSSRLTEPERPAASVADIWKIVAGGYESEVQRKNGASVSVHVCVSRVQLYDRELLLILFRDITERKEAQERLRKEAERAQLLLDLYEQAPQLTDQQLYDFTLDQAVRLTDSTIGFLHLVSDDQQAVTLTTWNREALKSCTAAFDSHYPIAEAGNWVDCIRFKGPVIDNDYAASPNQKGLPAGHAPVRRFMSIPVMDGDRVRIVFGVANKAKKYDDHDVVQIQLVANELQKIIRQRHAEDALRASELRFSTVFSMSPTAICIIRASDGRFVDVNDAFARATGYSRNEIIGRTTAEMQLWTNPLQREAVLQALQLRGTLDPFKLKGRKKSGETVVGLCSTTRVTLNGEEHFLSLIHDITDLEQAEEALRESEQRFRQVTENIDEVFWLTDTDKRQMIYVSPAYQQVWGRTCDSLYAAPLSWLEAIHPVDKERVTRTVARQAAGGYDVEFRIVRPDGTVRWVHDRAFPIKAAQGQVERIAGVAEDITARRQIEEQFRQAQKMEAVGQLAGGIAHDFNNLLAVIQMQSSLLLVEADSGHNTKEGIQQIMAAAERAANLTRRLLTFSRRDVRQAKDLDLGEVIGSMSKLLRRILGEDITLETRFAPGLPLVNADPGMLEQVLMNLVVNSRDAMPKGGCLTIALDAMDIDESRAATHPQVAAGRFACLTVRDTGCGIAREDLPRIFEPFFTTKEVGKGTGLGLATVFGIVQQHRGWIEVESEVNQGTAIHVYLPALHGSATPWPAASPEAPVIRGGSETILLVEDEESVRTIARAVLERFGYRVLEADSAATALRLWEIQTDSIDLLLTDLIMPGGVSGRELADQLIARQPRLKVIFTSGYSNDIVGRQLHLDPGRNFLQKPYPISDLAATVRRAFDEPCAPATSEALPNRPLPPREK